MLKDATLSQGLNEGKKRKKEKRVECIKDCVGCARKVHVIAKGVYYSLPTGTK